MQQDLPNTSIAEQRTSPATQEQVRDCIPPVATHMIQSRYVDQTFKIEVMRPVRRAGEVARFPVVYATDGNLTFGMFSGISHVMQASGRDAARFMLVGIGYPGDSPHSGAMLRRRDLTFPGYPKLSSTPPPHEGALLPKQSGKDFCGGEEFQLFLENELIPHIDRTYESHLGERTYFGHSVGAGFGLFTLFSRPRLFSNYIISSPGLIFHGESPGGVQYDDYDFLLQRARSALAAGVSFQGIKVYMSVGTQEEFEQPLAGWRLTSSFYRMAALLQASAIPGFRLITEVLAGETHATAWPIAYVHGIRALLGARPS
jgi:uncharacterized protein